MDGPVGSLAPSLMPPKKYLKSLIGASVRIHKGAINGRDCVPKESFGLRFADMSEVSGGSWTYG